MRRNLIPDEYVICEKRGHEPSGKAITEGMGPTWQYCRWCGSRYRFTEPELVEHPEDFNGMVLVEIPDA